MRAAATGTVRARPCAAEDLTAIDATPLPANVDQIVRILREEEEEEGEMAPCLEFVLSRKVLQILCQLGLSDVRIARVRPCDLLTAD